VHFAPLRRTLRSVRGDATPRKHPALVTPRPSTPPNRGGKRTPASHHREIGGKWHNLLLRVGLQSCIKKQKRISNMMHGTCTHSHIHTRMYKYVFCDGSTWVIHVTQNVTRSHGLALPATCNRCEPPWRARRHATYQACPLKGHASSPGSPFGGTPLMKFTAPDPWGVLHMHRLALTYCKRCRLIHISPMLHVSSVRHSI
jgi:hypothetical protein